MKLSVQEYAKRPRHPGWERELVRSLRSMPEAERREFLDEFLSVRASLALLLARKCLAERASFEAILARGLKEADASSLRYWLECVVPRLGVRRVARSLLRHAEANPGGVRKALYWLPLFADAPGYDEALTELEALRER